MNSFQRSFAVALAGFLPLLPISQAHAQSATVTLSSQKQYIRGFGGMLHAAWVGDLTAAERTLAFGSAAGQLNFSIARIPVSDGNPSAVDVTTAKAAIANGAIIMATPWNAAKTYTSADFASYATHLNNFVTYMKGQGVDLYSISVQNEPDYGTQAGWGAWSAASCHDFILNYGASITGAKLMGCESFNYNKPYYDAVLNDSAALANVGLFGTHLYGTAVSAYAYANWNTKGTGKEMWMTEHYTDSTTDANSWPNALGVASEIHNVMVTGQMNAYVWWTIKRSYGPIYNGAVTKRGNCMGHWSKFVRPGSYRVDATASPGTGLSLSAYKSATSVVINVVNTGSASTLAISIPGSTIASFTKYTTSSSKSLASDGAVTASNGSLSVSLDASSVTSLVGSGSSPPAGGSSSTGGSSSVGGATGTGGSVASGGSPSTGGSKAAGGSSSSGGSKAVGGSTNTGGSKAAGGTANAGGVNNLGGAVASGGSTSVATGGSVVVATGGAVALGGQNSGGNVPTTGGTAIGAKGGATSVAVGGGLPASGGATVDASSVGSGTPDSGGCSCQTVGAAHHGWMSLGPMLIGLLTLLNRRRRGSGARG